MRWRGIITRLRWRAVRWVGKRARRLVPRLLPRALEDRSNRQGGARQPDPDPSSQDAAAAALLEWRARAAPGPPRHWLQHVEAAGRRFKATWIHAVAPAARRTLDEARLRPAEDRSPDPRPDLEALEFPPLPVRHGGDEPSRRMPGRAKVFIRHGAPSPDAAPVAKIVDRGPSYASPGGSQILAGALEQPHAKEGTPAPGPSQSRSVDSEKSAIPHPAEQRGGTPAAPQPAAQRTPDAAAASPRSTAGLTERRDSRQPQNASMETGAPARRSERQIEPVSYQERSRERVPSSFSPAMQFERSDEERDHARVAPAAVGPRHGAESLWPEFTATPLQGIDDPMLAFSGADHAATASARPPLSFGAWPPRRSSPTAMHAMDPLVPDVAPGGSLQGSRLDAAGEEPGRWPTLPGTSPVVHEDWRAMRRRLERLDRLDREQRGA